MLNRITHLTAWAVAFAPSAAQVQYPSAPIRLIVPNAPGGASDATGRLFGGALSAALGRQVIIDNRSGAGGNIALAIGQGGAHHGHAHRVIAAVHSTFG